MALGLLFVGAIRAVELRFIIDAFLRLYGSILVLFVGVFLEEKRMREITKLWSCLVFFLCCLRFIIT